MKILFSLTYYRPHVSGLTIYVQRLAQALAKRGHSVTVLASQHSSSLPQTEVLEGVQIVRVPVAFWISKGAIMPQYFKTAYDLLKSHDLAVINLPNTFIEALALPFIARFILKRPILATYHCDINLPPGVMNRVIDYSVFFSNYFAAAIVNNIVAYTQDYASFSPVVKRFPKKTVIIPPPVIVGDVAEDEVARLKQTYAPHGEKLVGFAARLASEKGVEYLLRAWDKVKQAFPGAKVMFAGDHLTVIGEGDYGARLKAMLEEARESWVFLGVVPPEKIASFFKACDVSVLPSINSTESFGLVQVESMLCGTPVVASNLPGVRVPIQTTGMGEIVPPKDSEALAQGIIGVLKAKERYLKPRPEVEAHFSLKTTVEKYEALFESLSKNP